MMEDELKRQLAEAESALAAKRHGWSEYDIQAAAFCDKWGVRIDAHRYPEWAQKPPRWATSDPIKTKLGPRSHGYRYCIVMKRGTTTVEFDYWGSIADWEAVNLRAQYGALNPEEAKREARAKKEPTPYSVLACVSGDINCPETFEEFCGDYGYDTDSRRAFKTFKATQKLATDLRRLFPEEEARQELMEIR